MPVANLLLSYDGNDTIARISPVCGFITIVTPWLTLADIHAPCQGLRREALRVAVDGEHEVLPRHRLADRLDDLHQPAGSVALDQLAAVVAAELILEGRLDPCLADDVIAQVAGRFELARARRD